MMLLWVLIIFILFYSLLSGKLDIDHFKSNKAVDLLDRRLAKGEISINKYKELKLIIKEKK